jgi:cysteine desulfurase
VQLSLEEFLTTDEAARALKVSTKTVLRLVRSGQLPACKVGRAYRIRRTDLVGGVEPKRSGVIYLDDNASNPIEPAVRMAVIEALSVPQANASSSHVCGQAARGRVEHARAQVAELVDARSSDVIFTSGATEANNLLLRGLVYKIRGRRVLISATEHASVGRVAAELAARGDIALDIIPVTRTGELDLDALDSMLSDDVCLVSVCAANSETGVLAPLAAIADRAHAYGAIFHCDATQWVGRLPLSVRASAIDALSLSGHKMCGPQGVGALILDRVLQRQLAPVAVGGGHEDGLRSGSYNVAGIVGLGVAATLAADAHTSERILMLRERLTSGLMAAGGIVNGANADRLPNTANIRFPGIPGDVILARTTSIAASLGSACHSGAPEPSPTLLAMGLRREEADESIRLSVTRFTTASEVDRAIAAITTTVREVRQLTEEVAHHAS